LSLGLPLTKICAPLADTFFFYRLVKQRTYCHTVCTPKCSRTFENFCQSTAICQSYLVSCPILSILVQILLLTRHCDK
jgi:hypothetical protein